MILKVACAESAVLLLSFLEPVTGKTHDQPPTHSQDACGPGRTHPALIFCQRVVQAVVQAGFNGPVSSLGVQESLGIQSIFLSAADQIAHFLGLAPTPANPCSQPSDLRGRGKADFLGIDGPGEQSPNLPPGAIMIPPKSLVGLLGLRGKKNPASAFSPECCREFLDSF